MPSIRPLAGLVLAALTWLGAEDAHASDAYWHGAYHRASTTANIGAYGAVSGLAMVAIGPTVWGRTDVGLAYVVTGVGALTLGAPFMVGGSARASRALEELDVLVDRRAGRRALGWITIAAAGMFVPGAGPFLFFGGWVGAYAASTTQMLRNGAAHRATFGRDPGWMLDDGPLAGVMLLPSPDPDVRGVRVVARF